LQVVTTRVVNCSGADWHCTQDKGICGLWRGACRRVTELASGVDVRSVSARQTATMGGGVSARQWVCPAIRRLIALWVYGQSSTVLRADKYNCPVFLYCEDAACQIVVTGGSREGLRGLTLERAVRPSPRYLSQRGVGDRGGATSRNVFKPKSKPPILPVAASFG
jgi:hypothetical protein